MNRARANPGAEGRWLATSTEANIADGRDFTGNGSIQPVNTSRLISQFDAIAAKPPAAFDVRLYNAALKHTNDLIARQAQDHQNQAARALNEGFEMATYRGNVFSYASNALNTHAALNIDWAMRPAGAPNTANGMQNPPVHRLALMAMDADYANVGFAAKYVGNTYFNDPIRARRIGEYVVTQNFASARSGFADHHNVFIVGTVYDDLNVNGRYDSGEGVSGVTVVPSRGDYYAVTSSGGGYAIPVTSPGLTTVSFTGNGITGTRTVTTNSAASVLVDMSTAPRTTGSGSEDLFMRLDTKYPEQFGSNSTYGTLMRGSSFIAEFEESGEDLTLQIRGYNITDKFQSQVLLNGEVIGKLTGTAPLGESARKTNISIPRSKQISGLNTIEVQYTGSSTWGVRGLKINKVTGTRPSLTSGVFNSNPYGWRHAGLKTHKTVVRPRFTYTGSNGVEFRVSGFNVIDPNMTSVYVNGTFVQNLAVTGSNGVLGNTMIFAPSLLVAGENTIEIRQNLRAGTRWGVKRMKVTQL